MKTNTAELHKVGRFLVTVNDGKVVSGRYIDYFGTVYVGLPRRMVTRSKRFPELFKWAEDKTMTLESFRGRVSRGTATIF